MERKGLQVGYDNQKAVYALSSAGRLNHERDGKPSLNSFAFNVLNYMAFTTYDWDSASNQPTEQPKKLDKPCRYYALGWQEIAKTFGMFQVSPSLLFLDDDKEMQEAVRRRAATAKLRISDAWAFLKKQELIKCIKPAGTGRNAGWLLTIGSPIENIRVEEYARSCLNLSDYSS